MGIASTIGLSPFQFKLYMTVALIMALAVFELATRLSDRQKIRSGQAEDLRSGDTALVKHNAVQHSKGRVWAEGLLAIAAGASLAVTMMAYLDYQDHGAFYDASWRSPDVEQHFEFSAKGNMALEAEYVSDMENFDWSAQNVVIVRMGCPDCERVAEAIHGFEERGYVPVFSTSELGKAYVERYGVTYVPSAILTNGLVVQLRSGDSAVSDEGFIAPELRTDGEKAQQILDDLNKNASGIFDGVDPDSVGEDYTKYGTKAAIEYAEEQERLAQEPAGGAEPED